MPTKKKKEDSGSPAERRGFFSPILDIFRANYGKGAGQSRRDKLKEAERKALEKK